MTFAHTSQPRHHSAKPVAALASPIRSLLSLSAETKIVLSVLFVLITWGLAILTFGVPALILPMTIVVPAMVVCLVLLTWGM